MKLYATQSALPGGIWHSDSSDSDDDTGEVGTTDSTTGVECTTQGTSNTTTCVHTVPVTTAPVVTTRHYTSAPSRTTALSTYSSLRKIEEEKRKHVRQ